jgi:hypothetical protein
MARRVNRASLLLLSAALGRGCGSGPDPAKGTGGSTALSSVATTGAGGSTGSAVATTGSGGAPTVTQATGGSTASSATTAGTGGATVTSTGTGGATVTTTGTGGATGASSATTGTGGATGASSSSTSAGTGGAIAFTGTPSNTAGTGGAPVTTTLVTAGTGGAPATATFVTTTTTSLFTTSTPSFTTSTTSSSTSSSTSAAPAFDTGGPLACAPGCAAGSCCIDAAPAGWTGPFQLYSGPTARAPACPQSAPAQTILARRDPRQDPALCSTCTVGQPYGQWCFAALAASSDGACTANDGGSLYFASDFCSRARGDAASAFALSPPQATYVCDASTQSPTLPPITWDTLALGCAATASACGAGKVCQPAPDAPFLPRLCVSKAGDASCPSGPFTDRAVYYTSALDQRSCTPCGYTPAPITCTGTALLYDDASCTSELASVSDFSGACLGLPDKFGSAGLVDPVFTGTPSCTPSGGVPTGAIAPSGAVTVCCTP